MLDLRTRTIDDIRDLLAVTLGLPQGRAAGLEERTPLFGALPELDSFAVVQLAMAIEERFRFAMEDGDFSLEVFETLGSLSDFIEARRTV